jgi:hypothetical protein
LIDQVLVLSTGCEINEVTLKVEDCLDMALAWRVVETIGISPSPRFGHQAIPVNSGLKMMVVGGYAAGADNENWTLRKALEGFSNDLLFLDLLLPHITSISPVTAPTAAYEMSGYVYIKVECSDVDYDYQEIWGRDFQESSPNTYTLCRSACKYELPETPDTESPYCGNSNYLNATISDYSELVGTMNYVLRCLPCYDKTSESYHVEFFELKTAISGDEVETEKSSATEDEELGIEVIKDFLADPEGAELQSTVEDYAGTSFNETGASPASFLQLSQNDVSDLSCYTIAADKMVYPMQSPAPPQFTVCVSACVMCADGPAAEMYCTEKQIENEDIINAQFGTTKEQATAIAPFLLDGSDLCYTDNCNLPSQCRYASDLLGYGVGPQVNTTTTPKPTTTTTSAPTVAPIADFPVKRCDRSKCPSFPINKGSNYRLKMPR